jgi:hypothetical protein
MLLKRAKRLTGLAVMSGGVMLSAFCAPISGDRCGGLSPVSLTAKEFEGLSEASQKSYARQVAIGATNCRW